MFQFLNQANKKVRRKTNESCLVASDGLYITKLKNLRYPNQSLKKTEWKEWLNNIWLLYNQNTVHSLIVLGKDFFY